MAGVYIAFGDDALTASPTWTSIDSYVQSFTIDRGRQSELDKTGTGTATVNLIDTTGRFDPTNSSGPFYGNLNPMKQAKIDLYNPVAGTSTTIFRGFVSEWLYDMDPSGKFSTITLELADAFDLFSALELTPGQHGDATGLSDFADVWFKGTPSNVPGVANVFRHVDDRQKDALSMAGWSATLEDIFSGNVSMQGAVYARRDQLMQVLDDAADAETPGLANRYMSKDGKYRFRGRFSRFFPSRPGYGINFWSCGDVNAAGGSVAPISGLSFRRSERDLINACLALPQGVAETDVPGQLVKDTTSIGHYGYRMVSFNDLLVSAGHDDLGAATTALQECTKFENYYVQNYKDPKTRITNLKFRMQPTGPYAAAVCALICGIEIGDVINTKTTHPGGGGFNEQGFIDGIHYEVRPMGENTRDVTLELDITPLSFYASNPFGSFDDS